VWRFLILSEYEWWLVREPLVFPSLGPTAYVMVVAPDAPNHQPRAVIGGHLLGVVAGLVGYHLFASGLTLTVIQSSSSEAVLWLVVSGIFAMAVTSMGMIWRDIDHAPACATTLIVALGLLQTFQDGVAILAAVVVLVIIEEGVKRAPYTLPRRQDN
jgi:CBS-domain-containing membrane protein